MQKTAPFTYSPNPCPQRVTATYCQHPYGMLMDGRSYSSNDYRWGFNGKENDTEISARGNCFDYGFRIYNSSIARFLSVDPLTKSYPNLTPYQFADNMPICAIDLDGLEAVIKINSVTVSETFLKIQRENGTEKALSYLKDNWMNTVHSENGMSWIGTITNGEVDPQVIRKAEVLGLPGILVVYTLEMTGARTAKFVENRYVLPDNRSWQEKFKDKLKRIGNVISGWFSSDQPRKKYMADWFQEWLNSRGAYEQLDDSKEILGLGLRPVTQDVIEFENRQSDNTPYKGPKVQKAVEGKVDSVDTEYATLWKQEKDTFYPIETETKRAPKHANGESRPIKKEKK